MITYACSMYRKIFENAQRIINLTAVKRKLLYKKVMIKMVIKVAVKCPNTPKTTSNNITSLKKDVLILIKKQLILSYLHFNNPF